MDNREEQPLPPSQPFFPFADGFLGEAILLVGFVLYEAIKKYLSNQIDDVTQHIYQVFEGDEKLREISEKILILFGADRVLVSTFVNGEKTPEGLHFYKLKIRTESLKGSTVSVCNIIGSDVIPIKNFMTEYETLLKEKEIEINKINLRKLPPPCKKHLRRINVKGLYQVMIFSDYVPIGLVTIHYTSVRNIGMISKVKRSNDFLSYLAGIRDTLKKPPKRWFFF